MILGQNTAYRVPNKRIARKKTFLLTILAGAVVFIALLTAVTIYTNELRSSLNQEMDRSLLEVSNQVELIVNERMSNQTDKLKTIANAMTLLDNTQAQSIQYFLQKEMQYSGFTTLAVAGLTGISVDMDGNKRMVGNSDYYLKALHGMDTISDVISSTKGTDVITCSVPIVEQGVVVGVVIATYDLASLKNALQVSIFDGQGVSRIISKDGIIIVSGEESDSYNIFTSLENIDGADGTSEDFKKNLLNNHDGILRYTFEDQHYFMCYNNILANDWYLLTSVPSDVVTKKTNAMLMGMLYVGIGISLVIMSLMSIIFIVQVRNKKNLEKIAFSDEVTGGISKLKFEIEAEKLLINAQPLEYSLVYLDVEKFKLINDTYGRAIGNYTLSYVLRAIENTLMRDELVSRFSGDNYYILMQYTSNEQLKNRLNALVDNINLHHSIENNPYLLPIAIGVYIIDQIEMDLSIMVERANLARDINGSQVSFYSKASRDSMVREKEIENKMHKALEEGEFEAYLQPKYEIVGNTIAGAEALVRWNDKNMGMIYPDAFIPLFERNGFIVEVDRFIFKKVCESLHKWFAAGVQLIPISVNLSKMNLRNQHFLDDYLAIYQKFNFPSRYLEFELTESIVFDDVDRLTQVINDIRDAGFLCSLDDFGCGQSSLNLLKELPVDVLKLDRIFFYSKQGKRSPAESNELRRSQMVVQSVVELAKKLGMKTVAEGIELKEQVDYLRSIHCDMVQGYYFAKPMPISEFERLLNQAEN